ncbi:tetratricopeptide repeat-containing sensor histidine kinase [Nibrella viscosa]
MRELARTEKRRPIFVRDSTRFRLLVGLGEQVENWEQARNYWQMAINLAEKYNWIAGRLEAYQGMGMHYRRKGSFLEAVYYFQRGLHLAEQFNDQRYQVKCYQTLGVAYSDAGDVAQSLKAHLTAAKLARTLDRHLYLSALNDIGNLYFHDKKYAKALRYYQQCIWQNQPVDSIQQVWFLVNKATTLQELNQPDSSIATFLHLFRFSRYFTREDSVEAYARLGLLYVKIGKTEQGLKYGLKAESLALKVHNYYPRSLASQALVEAYAAKKQWESAFFYGRQVHIYRDSILSQEQRQRLEAAKEGYKSEKRRTENEYLNAKMRIQQRVNKLLWTGLGLISVLGGSLIYVNILLRKRGKEIENQKNEISRMNSSLERRVEVRTAELLLANKELKRKNKEIEEALLKGQTLERKRVASELHDNLGGTLAAIQWYINSLLITEGANSQNNFNDLYHMVARAYGEVRLLAHHMMPEVLEKEGLENALHELAIPINKSKRLQLTVETEPVSAHLTTRQKFELYSIALELCTNILKHARATEAYLRLNRNADEVIMEVNDNGIGIDEDIIKQGMGLKNIQNRLDAVGGRYSLRSLMGEGTMVLISIPYLNSQSGPVEVVDHEPEES